MEIVNLNLHKQNYEQNFDKTTTAILEIIPSEPSKISFNDILLVLQQLKINISKGRLSQILNGFTRSDGRYTEGLIKKMKLNVEISGTKKSYSKINADNASAGTVDNASAGTVDNASAGTVDNASAGTVDNESTFKCEVCHQTLSYLQRKCACGKMYDWIEEN